MIPASADFLAQEARLIGAQPVVWVTIYPKQYGSGLGQGGVLVECAYVPPDKIQADYHGFALGYWAGIQKFADLGRSPSTVTLAWDWNTPGYDMSVWWRSAKTLATLAASAWTEAVNGAAVTLHNYYQLKVEWRGYRCWTLPAGGTLDAWTAYAVPNPTDPAFADYLSYAAPCHHPGDVRTYISAVQITGEYPVGEGDVEAAGRLTLEAPDQVDDLVAGDHTGLALNNRTGKFSPGRANFIFAEEPAWQNAVKYIKTEIGYRMPGRRTPEMILAYLGQITADTWLNRTSDQGALQAHTAEIYSQNLFVKLLEYKIGQPDADGNPQPYCGGEFLAEAKKLAGKPLVAPLRNVDFETYGLQELDRKIIIGGGALSLETTDPVEGTQSLRATVAAVGDQALGLVQLRRIPAEFMAVMKFRITAMPDNPVKGNCTFLQLLNDSGAELARLEYGLGSDAKPGDGIKADLVMGGRYPIEFVPAAMINVPVTLAIWSKADKTKVWINSNEAVKVAAGVAPRGLAAGAYNRSAAEAWVVHVDQIRLYTKYHDQAYQVPGFPFAEIKTIYRDEVAQAKDATLELFPEYGAVNFLPADGEDISGTVKLLVRKDNIDHAVDHIQGLITRAGAGAYVDAASFAAGKAATPDYLIGVNFEKMNAAAALKEICSRCLYYLFMDHNVIRLAPFLGAALTTPATLISRVNDLRPEELREARLNPCDKADVKKRVSVIYGENDHNPSLCVVAGSSDPNEDTADLDLSYGSPVATNNETMARQIADRYLILCGPRQVFDPLRLTWRGARNELAETVRVTEQFLAAAPLLAALQRKEINLDPPRETTLRAVNYLETQ